MTGLPGRKSFPACARPHPVCRLCDLVVKVEGGRVTVAPCARAFPGPSRPRVHGNPRSNNDSDYLLLIDVRKASP